MTEHEAVEPATRFELEMVRETGVSVAQQRAMTHEEWFDRCGPASLVINARLASKS